MARARQIIGDIGRGLGREYVAQQKAKKASQASLDELILQEALKRADKKWEPKTMEEALEFERAKQTPDKMQDILLAVLGGLKPVTDIVPPETVAAQTPIDIGGRAMGGQVMARPGTTFQGGQMFSPTGQQIGEYAPGYEPTARPDIGADVTANMLRQQLGIGQEEAKRKYLGLPETKPTFQQEMEKLKQKEIIQGVSGEVGGRVALAKESIKNIQDIKKLLFPTGKAESFQRWSAGGANIPGATAPIIGAIIPEKAPFRKVPQEIFRKMGAALSGRQLIQTGVAARPEETARLVSQFAPGLFSNPESALRGLNELENFYEEYLKISEPETRFGMQKETQKSGGTLMEDANGNRAMVYPDGSYEEIR